MEDPGSALLEIEDVIVPVIINVAVVVGLGVAFCVGVAVGLIWRPRPCRSNARADITTALRRKRP